MRIIASSFLLCLLGLTAEAATLQTPSLFRPAGSSLVCSAGNAGKKPLDVTVDFLSPGGAVVETKNLLGIQPGGSGAQDSTDGGAVTCRFRFKGSARNVRAAGCTLTGPSICSPVVDAR